jgi:hypothetical protein
MRNKKVVPSRKNPTKPAVNKGTSTSKSMDFDKLLVKLAMLLPKSILLDYSSETNVVNPKAT